MNSFSQIRSKVDQELENLRKQKSLLQTEVKTLSENNNTENLRNEFDNFYNQSRYPISSNSKPIAPLYLI